MKDVLSFLKNIYLAKYFIHIIIVETHLFFFLVSARLQDTIHVLITMSIKYKQSYKLFNMT